MSDTPSVISDPELLQEALAMIHRLHDVSDYTGIGQPSETASMSTPPMRINGSTIIASIDMHHFHGQRATLNLLQTAGAIQFAETPIELSVAYGRKYHIQVLDMQALRTAVATIGIPRTKGVHAADIKHKYTLAQPPGAEID